MASIAKAVGTNRNSLAVAFKAVHGCGVFSWFKQKRLFMARDALCYSGASVQSVTYQFGFSDPANFSRAYKSEFGISPSKARNMLITVDDTKDSEIEQDKSERV
ncbi:helix-turn-helix domain-containing protein [Aurantivibrio plasticivorans]